MSLFNLVTDLALGWGAKASTPPMELRARAAAAPAPARRQVRRDIMILRDNDFPTQDVPHKRYNLEKKGDRQLSLPKSRRTPRGEQGFEGRQHGNTEGRWAGTRNSQTFSFTADGACDVLVVLEYGNLHKLNIKTVINFRYSQIEPLMDSIDRTQASRPAFAGRTTHFILAGPSLRLEKEPIIGAKFSPLHRHHVSHTD